ncbi:MAG TPA: ABC transporter ATP-binding protein [Pirellulaceae bacterium]|nr:ABC transporter ATP-binding protein [Pirellulaceae bacterium]
MKPAIRVDGLSKHYRLGERQQGYTTLRESIANAVKAPFRRFANPQSAIRNPQSNDFWALKDVSFEVQPGEVVGIIGRNGAGKSTLLKILSRITEPTSGRIELRGRVGSLLEVGTGFHPELTGRENIFMNGSILGMPRREIARKFDEIVAFAEVEEFLDTPVKRYSSGMYVRLAFAVAAHLHTEVLFVDEVLAVGDAAFQAKCLGRIKEISKCGRTVLFVSHNMAAVEALCGHAVLMSGGRISYSGTVEMATRRYHNAVSRPTNDQTDTFRPGNGASTVFRSAVILDDDGNESSTVPVGGRFHLRIGVESPTPLVRPIFGVGIDNQLGQRVLSLLTPVHDCPTISAEKKTSINCVVPLFPLTPGTYSLKCSMALNGHEIDWVDPAMHFTVTDGNLFGEGRGAHRGYCVAPSQWEITA